MAASDAYDLDVNVGVGRRPPLACVRSWSHDLRMITLSFTHDQVLRTDSGFMPWASSEAFIHTGTYSERFTCPPCYAPAHLLPLTIFISLV